MLFFITSSHVDWADLEFGFYFLSVEIIDGSHYAVLTYLPTYLVFVGVLPAVPCTCLVLIEVKGGLYITELEL